MRKKTVWTVWIPAILFVGSLFVCFVYQTVGSFQADREAPQILIEEGELSISVKDPESALLEGVTAVDAVDGDVTDTIVIESIYGISTSQEAAVSPIRDSFTTLPVNLTQIDRVKVTYAAFDQAGNVAKAERQICYTDYKSPKITLSAPLVFAYGSGFDVMDCIKAKDVIDGDISHLVKASLVSETSSLSAQGEHEAAFRVTNSLGDTTQLILPVEVYEADRYNAELKLKQNLVYLSAGTYRADDSEEDFSDDDSYDDNGYDDDSYDDNGYDDDSSDDDSYGDDSFDDNGSGDNDSDDVSDTEKRKVFDSRTYLKQFQFLEEVISLEGELPYEIDVNMDVEISEKIDFDTPGVYPVSYTVSYQEDGRIYTGHTRLLVVIE